VAQPIFRVMLHKIGIAPVALLAAFLRITQRMSAVMKLCRVELTAVRSKYSAVHIELQIVLWIDGLI
jgi:hypothetical protein